MECLRGFAGAVCSDGGTIRDTSWECHCVWGGNLQSTLPPPDRRPAAGRADVSESSEAQWEAQTWFVLTYLMQ